MQDSNPFEMIHYHGANYKFTIWGVEYIEPHFHREVEVWLLLHGKIALNLDGSNIELEKGDFCVIDSFKMHEIKAISRNDIPILMVMHMKTEFFAEYFPRSNSTAFPFHIYNWKNMDEKIYTTMAREFLSMGIAYFKKEEYYQLKVAGMINLFYARMLTVMEHEVISEEAKRSTIVKSSRLKQLTDYIQEHYSEKLLLSDLADREAISMSRLSHVFKECFGKSFQDYLLRVRCERAKELLRDSDMNLLDISMDCGFSDPKYFNQGFEKIYGCRPKEYRRQHRSSNQTTYNVRKDVIVKSGSFLTDEDCYLILEYCLESISH